MARYLFALIVSLGLAALVAIAPRIGAAAGRFWRALVITIASLLALIGLAIGIAGLEYDAWWAAIAGVALLVMSFRLGWNVRRSRSRSSDVGIGRSGLPSTADLADPRWRRFQKQLVGGDRQRAHNAQLAIQGFLAERTSPALTSEHQSLLLSLEKRVPELIDACTERCRRARAPERARYLEDTLQRLEQIAGQAERARVEVRRADDQRLEVLHRYFDGVAPAPEALPGSR